MRRILLISADRAEKGLMDSIYEELSEREDVIAKWCLLDSHEDPVSNLMWYRDELEDFQPHIILLPCDRSEITYVAAYSFHKGFVNFHFHAGNFSSNHSDDINRKVISLYSHVMLCNMSEHKTNLVKQGEEAWRIHVTGSTAFDNITFDDSVTPKEPFRLIILHPDPTSAEKTKKDLEDVFCCGGLDGETVWIYPNHDKNYEVIEDFLKNCLYPGEKIHVYQNLPRPQFLDLLRKCEYAIGNSSAFYYEGPILNTKFNLIQIGDRNKALQVPPTKTGGSKRIAEILATIELTDELRVKRLKN